MKPAIVLLIAALGLPVRGQTNSVENGGSVLNVRQFSGNDIGAQVNAAAVKCKWGSVCHIVIPPSGPVKLTTQIVMVDGEEVECSRSGYMGSWREEVATQLEYTGGGVAVTMNGRGDSIVGYSLRLSAKAATGVWMGGHSDRASQITVRGAGTGTTLVRISGRDAEDIHLEDSRLVNFCGDRRGSRSRQRHLSDSHYRLWSCS